MIKFILRRTSKKYAPGAGESTVTAGDYQVLGKTVFLRKIVEGQQTFLYEEEGESRIYYRRDPDNLSEWQYASFDNRIRDLWERVKLQAV